MEGKELVVVHMEGRVEELEFGKRATMEERGMEGKKWNNPRSRSTRAVKFPGAPAWEPAGAGREAGRGPEPAGLGTGQGRAGGRVRSRASRPGSRPGPGVRPGQAPSEPAWEPAWAGSEAGQHPGRHSFLRLHPSLLVLIFLTSDYFCIIRNIIEQPLSDPGEMQNMM